jgi:Nitrous oxidase accessory protein
MRKALYVLFILTLLLSGYARADEGRVPVYQQTTITQPGYYLLTRDISATSGDVITVQSSNVVVDLNGHLISQGDPAKAGVYVTGAVNQVTVRNGRITGGTFGVRISATVSGSRFRVEKIKIDATADGILFGATGSGSTIYAEVLECDVTATSDGISGSSEGTSGTLSGNTVTMSGGIGISVWSARGMQVLGNRITGGLAGINLSTTVSPAGGNIIQGNTVYGASVEGLQINSTYQPTKGNLIKDNVFSFCGLYGMEIDSSDNTIVGNVASYNKIGIFVGANGQRNLIDANQLNSNTGSGSYGIYFGANGAHAYRNNIIRGNGTGTVGGVLTGNTNAGGNIT